jgi:hypothetical protein
MNSTLSNSDVPTQAIDYRAEIIDEEIMLYSEEKTEAIYLNQAASTVWILCDGANTVSDIVESITEHYSEESARGLGEEVSHALDELLSKHVILIK